MRHRLASPARRRASLTLLAAIMLAVSTARADAPPASYFNGFETGTSGWLAGSGTLTRQASGYTNGGGYADGIASATGTYHARLTGAACTLPNPCYGPYTYWGGYYQNFPINGYRTELNIYLDVAWAGSHPDVRFDYVSSITNSSDETFLRDFVFNAGTNPANDTSAAGFYINATTNSFRANTYPTNPCPVPNTSQPPNVCRAPVHITTSGWYTFKHRFYDDGTGHLAVSLQIFPLGNNVPVADWTIYSTTDAMAIVGGNRYGWLANEEIPDLPIDDSLRTGLNLALAPATATNFVSTDHTVTATVTTTDTGGHPTFGPGEAVEFDVISGPNTGQTSHPSNTGSCLPSNCTTDANGLLSWTYTSNGTPGTDTIQACFPDRPATDGTGAAFKHAVGDEARQCQTVTKVWQPQCTDTTPPAVSLYNMLAGPPKTVVLKAQDAGGIANIVVIAQTNIASVKYSQSPTGSPQITFPHAPVTPVYIFAAKLNQSAGSVIGVAVTDACGNVTNFDPIDVAVNSGGKREAVTVTGVGGDENLVQILNDGLRAMRITINDHVIEVGLTPSEVRFVDIGSALVPGDGNTVTFEARGPHDAHAAVIISPGTAPSSQLGFNDRRHGHSVHEIDH